MTCHVSTLACPVTGNKQKIAQQAIWRSCSARPDEWEYDKLDPSGWRERTKKVKQSKQFLLLSG